MVVNKRQARHTVHPAAAGTLKSSTINITPEGANLSCDSEIAVEVVVGHVAFHSAPVVDEVHHRRQRVPLELYQFRHEEVSGVGWDRK